jgi:excisionase family DNA binding protein
MLLTARTVADMVGVSPETVLRWTRRGELPAIRLPGRAIRIRSTSLEKWLESRELAPSPRHRLEALLNDDAPAGQSERVDTTSAGGDGRDDSGG